LFLFLIVLKTFVLQVISKYQTTSGQNDNDADNGSKQIDEQRTSRGLYMEMQRIKTDNDSNFEYIEMTIQT
jgi:hypothetical protein